MRSRPCPLRVALLSLVPLACATASSAARADVHAEFGGSLGGVFRDSPMAQTALRLPDGTPSPPYSGFFGVSAELVGLVAVFPLVRAGPYAFYNFTPKGGLTPPEAIEVFAGGLVVQLEPPIGVDWSVTVRSGVGYGALVEPDSGRTTGIFEVPLLFGVAHRFSPRLKGTIELGPRFEIVPAASRRADLVNIGLIATVLQVGLHAPL